MLDSIAKYRPRETIFEYNDKFDETMLRKRREHERIIGHESTRDNQKVGDEEDDDDDDEEDGDDWTRTEMRQQKTTRTERGGGRR